MFSIFIDESGTGKIRSGEFSESFFVNIDQVRLKQIGEMIWRKEIKKFIIEGKVACILYTEKSSPIESNFWRGWILRRSDREIFLTEKIFMFDWILRIAIALRIFDVNALEKRFLLMVERELPLDPKISKWSVSEDELKMFLES